MSKETVRRQLLPITTHTMSRHTPMLNRRRLRMVRCPTSILELKELPAKWTSTQDTQTVVLTRRATTRTIFRIVLRMSWIRVSLMRQPGFHHVNTYAGYNVEHSSRFRAGEVCGMSIRLSTGCYCGLEDSSNTLHARYSKCTGLSPRVRRESLHFRGAWSR